MYLIQILLPLYTSDKESVDPKCLLELRQELTETFGGITTYSRTPAHGLWKENDEKTVKDDLITFEILAESVDLSFWGQLKSRLELQLDQREILIRYWEVQVV
jgi:hypothetical protein